MENAATHALRSAIRPAAANDNRRFTPLSKPAFPADAVAHIHRPCRSTMTSGPAEPEWRLEFDPRSARFLDPLMGWTGGRDPLRQVALSFPTLDAALAYAERQGLRTIVHHDAQSRRDQRDAAKRAFSDGTLRQLGLGRLQQSYGEAMAQASRGEEKPQRQVGDSPMDVVFRPDLSVDEKRSILMNWAFDLYLILQRQSDDAAASRLSEIEEAVRMMESRAGARPACTAHHEAA
jgi:ETC complex I subunit-like protein